jgi:hypothetical protein
MGRRTYLTAPVAVAIQANRIYTIRVDYRGVSNGAYLNLFWGTSIQSLVLVPYSSFYTLYPVSPAPFPLVIRSAATSAIATECSGAGLINGMSGRTSSFQCCPRDALGNLRVDDDWTVSHDGFVAVANISRSANLLSGMPDVVTASMVFDSASKCFRGFFVPLMAGIYQLNVGLLDDAGGVTYVNGSPFQPEVFPSITSAFYSILLDLPTPLQLASGLCVNFSVVAKDSWNNLRARGGDNLQVYAERVGFLAGDPAPRFLVVATGSVSDQASGTYNATICPTLAGSYLLHVMLNPGLGLGSGDDVSASPYPLLVVYGVPAGSSSVASGSGLSKATVGVPAYFFVTVKDSAGNIVRGSQSGVHLFVTVNNATSVPIALTDLTGGLWRVEYVPSLQGVNIISVVVNGDPVVGNPFAALVGAGSASSQSATATGDGLSSGVAGVPAVFVITSSDADGNRNQQLGAESYVFNATLVRNSSVSIVGTLQPCVESIPVCAGDLAGRFFGSFTPHAAGEWRVAVYLSTSGGLSEIASSPFMPYVRPGSALAQNTLISGSVSFAEAGAASFISVQLFDADLNPLDAGGNIVELHFVLTGGEQLGNGSMSCCTNITLGTFSPLLNKGDMQAQVSDLGNGSYLATYRLFTTGSYVLRVSLLSPGLNASYFNSTWAAFRKGAEYSKFWDGDISGSPQVFSVAEDTVDINISRTLNLSAIPSVFAGKHRPESWGVEYKGLIRPMFAELYSFSVVCDSATQINLFIGLRGGAQTLVLATHDSSSARGLFLFNTTDYYTFRLLALHSVGDTLLQLLWESPSTLTAVVPSGAFFRWSNASHSVLEVLPGNISARQSSALGSGLSSVTAGYAASFMVTARDAYGNALQTGGDTVDAFLVQTTGGDVIGAALVSDLQNSSYLVEYLPRIAGLALIYVTLGCGCYCNFRRHRGASS